MAEKLKKISKILKENLRTSNHSRKKFEFDKTKKRKKYRFFLVFRFFHGFFELSNVHSSM